jgi:hypothetical protein
MTTIGFTLSKDKISFTIRSKDKISFAIRSKDKISFTIRSKDKMSFTIRSKDKMSFTIRSKDKISFTIRLIKIFLNKYYLLNLKSNKQREERTLRFQIPFHCVKSSSPPAP